MLTTLIVLIAVNLAGYLVIYLVLRQRIRRASPPVAQAEALREEVSRLVIELNQTTDRNIGLIEDRIASLMELLSKADKKIGLLRREGEKHDMSSQVYGRIMEAKEPARALSPAARQPEDQRQQPRAEGVSREPARQRAGSPASSETARAPRAADISSETARAPRAADISLEMARAPRAPTGSDSTPSLDGQALDARDQVLALYRAGFAPSLIAPRLGVPLGEVELIISLAQRKGMA